MTDPARGVQRSASPHPGPLAGMRVLELAQIMAGPTCGMMLADMGADVIKVEKLPGGDDARGYREPRINGVSAPFLILNRNKRGIAIDLKRDEGRAILLRLVETADVLTENFRRGTLEKLGLGYDVLARVNPGLIYCAISGYGRDGPFADKGGFDLIAQGFAGLMSITGEPGGPPVKTGNSVADINAGLLAVSGILAAYVHKLKTGRGQVVDTSLMEAARAADVLARGGVLRNGRVAGADGIGASADRTLPGVSHRGRLGQHRRRQPGELGAHRRRARPSRVARRSALRDERRAHDEPRRAGGLDERSSRDASDRCVDRRLRCSRRSRRPRQFDRRRADAPPDARARNGRRSRAPAGRRRAGAGMPAALLVDADGDRRVPRRSSASTRGKCCLLTATRRRTSIGGRRAASSPRLSPRVCRKRHNLPVGAGTADQIVTAYEAASTFATASTCISSAPAYPAAHSSLRPDSWR